ncbi:MAG: universal stress protein [Thermoproteota archaeon]|nr:universal stress protein [Thermoproteota archaeon]
MENHKISRILVAIDGSEESMAAATYAITMARIYDAELLALTVMNTQPWFYSSITTNGIFTINCFTAEV